MTERHPDHEARSWFTFLSLGFGIFSGESVVVFAYLGLSPHGPHRSALTTIALGGAVAGALNLVATRWLSRKPWRETYSLVWTLAAGLILTYCIVLDGGLSSPLLLLMLLPLMYGALVFGPFAVGACVVAAVVEVAVVAATDTGTDERPGSILMALAVAVGIGLVVWLAARHRSRLQERARTLTEELERLATTDGLTGCLNHRAFYERLDDEIERAVRYHQPLSLIVTDIDHFKDLNDALGHQGGDEALRLVSRHLRDGSRRPDAVGRIGGDEFAVVLPATTLEEATAHARRLLRPAWQSGTRVTLSAGMASLSPAAPNADQLFRAADAALYHTKRTGRSGLSGMERPGVPVRIDLALDQQPMSESSGR